MTANAYRLAAAFTLTFVLGGAAGYLVADRSEAAGSAASTTAFAGRATPARSQSFAEADRGSALGDFGNDPAALSVDGALARRVLAAVRARDYFQRRHDIYEVGQQLNADTIRPALEATQQFPEVDREQAQYALIARWLELDPAAAYDWVGALPKQGQRSKLMREFFHSLGLKDPVMAMSFLARHNAGSPGGENFTYSVLEAWSAHDPIAAVNAALALPDKESQGSAVQVALGRWAKRDPHGALSRIGSLPDADARRGHLQVILREWAKEDPEAAGRHADSLPDERDRHEALASIIGATGATDPEATMRLVEKLPAGAIRTRALTDLIRAIGYEEPAIAAEFVLALPPSEQRQAVHQVFHNFGRKDPAAALDFAGRLTSNEARASAVSTVMQSWSSKDPKAAAEYCASSPLGTPDAMRNAVGNWARKNAPEALAWSRALPDGAQREAALGSAVVAIAMTDPQQAATLATTMLNGDKQTQALSSIAGTWAAKDPRAAAAWAAKLSDRFARMNAESGVAHQWARQDPAAAAAWASQAAESAHTLPAITREWAALDSAAAAKWIDSLPAGNTRDSVVGTFSRVVVDTDPAGAAEWAATIADMNQRENAMGQIFTAWNRADPKAAETWLRATPGLSDQARERLGKWR